MAFDPDKLRKTIKKGGFEVRDFQVTLQATVEHREDGYWLDANGIQSFKVKPANLENRLEQLVGKRVRARGKVITESETVEIELTDVSHLPGDAEPGPSSSRQSPA